MRRRPHTRHRRRLKYGRLSHVGQTCLRPATHRAAGATLIDHQASTSLAQAWDGGFVASSVRRAAVDGEPVTAHAWPRSSSQLHADRGYDYDHLRQWLSRRGIRHRIARKGIESSQRLGRHRRVVERTVSWPAGCRRLHRRHERKAEHFLAFVGIAAALIGYRRLTT